MSRIENLTVFICMVVSILIATNSIFNWYTSYDNIKVVYRKPGLDNTDERYTNREEVNIGKHFKRFNVTLSKQAGKLEETWSGFRGNNFDNIYITDIKLKNTLSENLNEIKWEHKLGEGYAAPVIYKGRVYILDYIESENSDALRCFDLVTGKELWRRWYNVFVARNHGKSRTVPAVNNSYVLTLGPKAHVMCVDRITGDLMWTRDMPDDYGSEIPQWYAGQCPLIDNNQAILAPAGKDYLLVGIDLKTGKKIWSTPNPEEIKMSHSSVIKMNIHGKLMYVYCGIGGIAGISAEKSDIGKMLWHNTKWQASVIAPSPVYTTNGKIFMTAGYGAGSAVFEVKKNNGKWQAILKKSWKPNRGIACEQQTPVLYNNMLISILPKDAGAYRQQLVASDPSDDFKIKIRSSRELRFGLGPYMIADNKIFVLDDKGVLSILKMTNKSFKLLYKKEILPGHDSWGPFAIADGYMLMRDTEKMICVDLRK